MASVNPAEFDPSSFTGRVRVFPLPNVVLFPHALLPLHIFEPRYRELMRAALADDGRITLALLAPGWEANYEGRPALEPTACLGRVTTHQRLPDGRYNLLLEGLARVRLVRELEPLAPFREFEAELALDRLSPDGASERATLAETLLTRFRETLAPLPHVYEPLAKALGAGLPLGALTDVVAFSLDLGLRFKQDLLVEVDVDRRAKRLLERMAQLPRHPKFPPEFSEN